MTGQQKSAIIVLRLSILKGRGCILCILSKVPLVISAFRWAVYKPCRSAVAQETLVNNLSVTPSFLSTTTLG